MLRAHLKAHYPWAEVELSELQASAELPKEMPTSVAVEKTPPGRSAFRLDFRAHRSIVITAMVRTFDRIFMSRNAFRKDYLLKQEDIYPALIESGRVPKGALREEERIVGKPLVRSVVPNAVITDQMVSETPIVKRGRKVMLSIESSGFSIRTAGETKQDAAIGSYVRTENLMSRKMVTGLLVDENTVRVEY
jgi:flagella basal body P-ring formation protein FlgA